MSGLQRPSAALYLAVYLLALIAAFLPEGPAGRLAGLLLLAFVVLCLPRLHWAMLAAGLLLVSSGLLLAPSGERLATLLAGAERTAPFMVLFAAVGLLQQPAGESPSLISVGRWITRQPPGRRTLTLALGGHILGAALNLAGLALVTSLLPSDLAKPERRRLLLAVFRGFSGAVCWSPLFVAMLAVLAALPETSWLEVLPYALACGLLITLGAWGLDRLTRRRPPGGAAGQGAARPPLDLAAAARLFGIFAAMAGLLAVLVAWGGLGMLTALGLMAPPFGFAWQAGIGRSRPAVLEGWRRLARRSLERLPGLGSEALLFLAANIFGAGLGQAIDGPALAEVLLGLPLGPDLRLLLVTVLGVLLAGLGLHPIVFVVAASHVLTPQALGFSPPVTGAMLTLVWSLGTAIYPFSASALQMSRLAGVSAFAVAWRWNGAYSLLLAPLGALLLALLSRLAT